MVPDLVERLSRFQPDFIIHSGLSRTRQIAESLAQRLNLEATAEPLWRERDFGQWEGLSWQHIWRETGHAMDGMMSDPAGFHPGQTGETTVEMVRRTWAAMRQIPATKRTIVIGHGGPIAAARLLADRLRFEHLAKLIVPTASHVCINSKALQRAIETPCIRLCALNASEQICTGCLRTRDEIGRWGTLNQQERSGMIETIRHRSKILV